MLIQKRPFSINEELERTEMIKLVVKLGKEFSSIEGDWIQEKDDYFKYKKCYFRCPCCDKITDWRRKSSYEYKKGDLKFDYETGYLYILNHIKNMVRLYGEEEHMKFIIEFFAKKRGIFILNHWAKRNIIISNKIKEFIQRNENDK